MLEYTKTILEKVSFNRELFLKELKKAPRFLSRDEVSELHEWVMQKFPKLIESFEN